MPTREDAKAAAVAAPVAEAPESKVEAPTSDATSKESKPKREPKVKAEPGPCQCNVPDHDKSANPATGDAVKYPGCRGGKTTRKFAPGHDARLVGYTTRSYVAGKLTAEQAIESVREKSGNSPLLVGKIKTAVKRADDEKVARERREQAAKDEKAAAATASPATPEAQVDAQAENAAATA